MSYSLFLVFVLAVLVICITPGPDMLYIVATSLSQGQVAEVITSMGMAVGMLVHTAAVAPGVAVVLAASTVAYDVITYGGAAYLVYMGIQTWLTGLQFARPPEQREPLPRRWVRWRATVTNILNLKIILFYLAFLPQFVDAGRGHPAVQLLTLGLTFVAIGLLVDAVIGIYAGRFGEWMQQRGKADTIINRIVGTVFIALGVRLVT